MKAGGRKRARAPKAHSAPPRRSLSPRAPRDAGRRIACACTAAPRRVPFGSPRLPAHFFRCTSKMKRKVYLRVASIVWFRVIVFRVKYPVCVKIGPLQHATPCHNIANPCNPCRTPLLSCGRARTQGALPQGRLLSQTIALMSTASELLSTTQLKERIAQELQRCTQLTAEQEDAKRGRDDAQERQRLRRDLENERASTASAQRFTRFFERQAADIDEDRVRTCILCSCMRRPNTRPVHLHPPSLTRQLDTFD